MKPKKHSHMTDDEKVRIRALYEDGHTLTEIAAAVGREFVPLAAKLLEVSEDAVKARMKELGYTAIPGVQTIRVTFELSIDPEDPQ